MEETLRALGGLLVQAIPTFIIVWTLYIYLRLVYFRPMERVLDARYRATEGARKSAEEILSKTREKTAEYEEKLRSARADIYREQEAFRTQLRQEQEQAIEQARRSASSAAKEAALQIEAELSAAQKDLERGAAALAGEISNSILRRRPV
jgi:F-type H+-transporting ATPase subunit b